MKIKNAAVLSASIIMALSFTGCGGSADNEVDKTDVQTTASVSEITTETTEETTTVITTEAVTTETEPLEPTSPWEIVYLKDKFDRPTNNKVLAGIFEGKFSNSVTTDSDSTLMIQVTDKDGDGSDHYLEMYISLFQYGNMRVYGSDYDSYPNYDVCILDENGKEYSWGNWLGESGYIIAHEPGHGRDIKATQFSDMVRLFRDNKKLTILVESEERSMERYLYEVDTTGFYENFSECFGDYELQYNDASRYPEQS